VDHGRSTSRSTWLIYSSTSHLVLFISHSVLHGVYYVINIYRNYCMSHSPSPLSYYSYPCRLGSVYWTWGYMAIYPRLYRPSPHIRHHHILFIPSSSRCSNHSPATLNPLPQSRRLPQSICLSISLPHSSRYRVS